MRKYISSIKAISDYEKDLERQNLWWTVVAMVGKVNNQGLEPQLLDSISETQLQFESLKSKLLSSLVKRYLDKLEVDLNLQAQSFIDILNRNLFERTADIGFLAEDSVLQEYLAGETLHDNQRGIIQRRLKEYADKYSVYEDIALFSNEFEMMASLSNPDLTVISRSPAFIAALNNNSYIEYDEPINNVKHTNIPLYFVKKVEYQKRTVGLLCMSFKFEDELNRIYKTLNDVEPHFSLSLIRADNQVMFHCGEDSTSSYNLQLNTFSECGNSKNGCFYYAAKTTGYQGYKGLSWISVAQVNIHNILSKQDKADSSSLKKSSALFPDDLFMLNLEINTALTIVVLNGKINSLKNKVESFLPVLDYFKDIGTEISRVFEDSINHIHSVAHKTMQEKSLFSAKLALDVMDRNLYERANDCRWWALNPIVKSITSSLDQSQFSTLSKTLEYINELYTVYALLFVFNRNGEIIGVSKSEYSDLIGTSVANLDTFKKIMSINSSQDYVVSGFEKSHFYNDRYTYIYSAAINSVESSEVIGGVSVIFDAEPEFQAILNDFLPQEIDGSIIEGSFAFFLDSEHKIISVSSNDFGINPGKYLSELDDGFSKIKTIDEIGQLVINGVNYIVARHKSQGYREYKIDDGYSNEVESYVFTKS